MTKLRKTLLVKNIVNHFEKGEKLRPWVKEWISMWWGGYSSDLEISGYLKPESFTHRYWFYDILARYNYLWNLEPEFPNHVEFRENHKAYIDDLYESVELADIINERLKIKKYRVRYLRVENNPYKGTRYRKFRLTVCARNIQEAFNQFWTKPYNGSYIKISKIKEGPLVGKYMIEPWNVQHLKIPYMVEKFKGRY